MKSLLSDMTLVESLGVLAKASKKAGLQGDLSPFQRAVSVGVSANLCDAVLGFAGAEQDAPFAVGVSWSKSRNPPQIQESSVIKFSPDTLPIIAEASRIWKQTSPREECELEGFVVGLSREDSESTGKVTIMGVVESKLRKVTTTLNTAAYNKAIEAHKQHSPIRLMGDLVKRGRHWFLNNARHLVLLEDTEEPQ